MVFLGLCNSYSQELLKPQLEFTNACASNSFNDYSIEITFINAPYNSDNVFTVELSDAEGNFSSPQVLQTISDKNFSFRFNSRFTFPQNVAGNNYKIRVKSSSPETTSPETDAFEAYFMSSEQLVLNNFMDAQFCEGESVEISIANPADVQYQWFKNGIKFVLGEGSLVVSEAGQYYCEIFYGTCNSPATSNIIEVTESPKPEAILLGDETVQICEGETYTIQSSETNPNFNYTWFKDGIKIENLPANTTSISVVNDNDLGSYYVEIENEIGCKNTSNTVTVIKTTLDFTVTSQSNLVDILLLGDSKTLSISNTASNGVISWFRNGVLIPNSNQNEIVITETGEYVAEVTETINNCSETKQSEVITIQEVVNFDFTINASDLEDCESTETTLTFDVITALDANNTSYTIEPNQYQFLQFNWYKDNVLVDNQTSQNLLVNDYQQNGNYTLEIANGITKSFSNAIEINLKIPSVTISSTSNTNSLCENGTLELSTQKVDGFTYQWFFNGNLIANAISENLVISETGNYYLQATGFGCTTTSNTIEVSQTSLDFSVSVNSPLKTILLVGETKELSISHTASNEIISWFKDDVEIPNSNQTTINITETGNYYAKVTATENGCSETKQSQTMSVNETIDFGLFIEAENYVACSSEQTTLTLKNITGIDVDNNNYTLTENQLQYITFKWFKNGSEIIGATSENLIVDDFNEGGIYTLRVENGNNFSISNEVEVSLVLPPVTITSSDASNSVCENKTIELSTDKIDGFTYQWFLNGNPISNATSENLTVSETGTYYLEVDGFGCTTTTNTIEVGSPDLNFSVSIISPLQNVLLVGETKTLTISHTASSAIIVWFKDDVEIPNSNQNSINITEIGEYYVEITETINGCSETKQSEKIAVNEVIDFGLFIEAKNYEECSSQQATLTLQSISAIDIDNNNYTLDENQLQYITFNWFKGTDVITNQNAESLLVESYTENDLYSLMIQNGDVSTISNVLEINLSLPTIEIVSSDSSNTLCSLKTIELSTIPVSDFTYQWFLNDVEIPDATDSALMVSESGKYHLEVTGFDCTKKSNEITIKDFDASVIETDFESIVNLLQGTTKDLNASGADSYEWQNENGDVLNTTSTFTISEAGNYRLFAFLNGCSVEIPFIVVVEETDFIIQNVLTPNGDGRNDFWQLPASLSNNNEVEVQIFNSGGVKVFQKTNYQNNWPENTQEVENNFYYYIIKKQQSIVKKGTISIIK